MPVKKYDYWRGGDARIVSGLYIHTCICVPIGVGAQADASQRRTVEESKRLQQRLENEQQLEVQTAQLSWRISDSHSAC